MRKAALLVMLILVMPVCLAQTIESNVYDFNIIYGKVLVENEILFEKLTDIDFTIHIPKDASAFSLYIDNEKQEPIIINNQLNLDYKAIRKIKIDYITKDLLEKDSFLANPITPFNTQLLKITLTLPEGAVLEKALQNGISGSIYPKPGKATTDGKSLIFEWQKEDIKKDDEIAIFVKYKSKSKLGWMLFFLFVIIIGLVCILFSRKTKTKVIVKREEAIEKHLKEDEEQVVNILKKREGKCEQGTLRVITGFSKASLSRLLKELEDRRIVYKEKRGKKNLVFLKK